MNFKNKKILITGGASGIGKIMVRKSLERGALYVVIWDINEEAMLSVKKEFKDIGGEIICLKIDISNLDEIKTTANYVKQHVGKIDVLINNAGIVVGKLFQVHSHTDISKSISINTNAPMHITLEFLSEMIDENLGAICNIASSAGLISNPKMSAYAASKWAVVGWSDSLRLEMKQQQKSVSVTTIMPFYINTGMFDGVKSPLLPILEPEPVAEKIIQSIEKKRKLVAFPLPYWFIRLSQGILPLPIYEWVMKDIFKIYDTMSGFKGRK